MLIPSSHDSSPPSRSFDISIIAADELLLVTLRFGPASDRDAIQCCMLQIADACAAVEGLVEKGPQDLIWEQKSLSNTRHCITLRRRFSDPDYPQKFEAAFLRLSGDIDSVRLH